MRITRSLRFLLVVAIPLAAGGCAGSSVPTTKTSRCEDVPAALVRAIASRLPARETLLHARAVRSRERESMWFVSAEIDGPGLTGPGDVGTWAKTGTLAVGVGPILSVDSVFAQQLSGWRPGDVTFANVTMDDDGAYQSRDCVVSG
jgi:hypothetical protein